MTGTPPLVSLYVAAYRQEATVRAAVESAFAQTWAPLEIILSDDCSPDGTYAVMEAMAAAYSGPHRVILNRNPRNLGIPAHTDRIMALSSGAFIVQNAGDDISVPERVETLVAAWLGSASGSGRRVKAVHSAKLRIDEAGRPQGIVPEREPLDRQHRPLRLLQLPAPDIYGASMGWSREIFDVFGPLGPTPLLEDFPICLRATVLGEVAYLPQPLLHYRVGGLSWREAEGIGRYALYGQRQRMLKWHLSYARAFLEDLDHSIPPRFSPPRFSPEEAAACRAQCAQNIRDFGLELDLAAMSHRDRLRALPGAVWRGIRHGDAAPARKTLKYLFDGPYMRWLDRRGTSGGA